MYGRRRAKAESWSGGWRHGSRRTRFHVYCTGVGRACPARCGVRCRWGAMRHAGAVTRRYLYFLSCKRARGASMRHRKCSKTDQLLAWALGPSSPRAPTLHGHGTRSHARPTARHLFSPTAAAPSRRCSAAGRRCPARRRTCAQSHSSMTRIHPRTRELGPAEAGLTDVHLSMRT